MAVCESCGSELSTAFLFCPRCGVRQPRAEAAPEVRKVVTILFTDLVGSTSMGEHLEPESLRRILDRYFETARVAIEHHGGVVEKFIGDAVMAVFGVPEAHEDDAVRAVRAAIEMRERLATLNEDLEAHAGLRLQTRTGVCSGEVVAGSPDHGERIVTGEAVNVAARLEQVAPLGGILLSDLTYRLVRGVVRAQPVPPLSLKGKREPASAWLLTDLEEGAEPLRRHFETPLVGREGELAFLADAFADARERTVSRLVTVLGAPGVGKTRLVHDFVAGLGETALVLRGRVPSYGQQIAFRPVVELLGPLARGAGSRAELTERFRELLGADAVQAASVLAALVDPGSPSGEIEEIPWAVRKLFEAIGRGGPLVAVLDDVHSAEAPLLDLIEHVAVRGRDAAMLIVCIARPDLLDVRPDWEAATGGATLMLEPLQPAASEVVAQNILGGLPYPASVHDQVVRTCEGNPLFVEQLVGSLVDDERLRRVGDAWVASGDLDEPTTPVTITALLEGRLERLPVEERAVLERASIEGQRFHEGALWTLTPEPERGAVDHVIQALIRRGLVRTDEPLLSGLDAFRFVHVLVHEAAYARLPKEARADLHTRYAEWLEGEAEARGVALQETIGWHLERAYRLRLDLGPEDQGAREIGLRAAELLETAAEREGERGNARGAYEMSLRAAELPAPSRIATGHRLLDAAFGAAGLPGEDRFPLLFATLDRADRIVQETSDPSLALRARALRINARGDSGDMTLDSAASAIPLERALRAPGLEPVARLDALATLYALYNDSADAERMFDAAERMVREADALGRPRLTRRAFWIWMTASLISRRDLPGDLARLRDRAPAYRGDILLEYRFRASEAILLAHMGRHEEADAARERCRAIGREVAFADEPFSATTGDLLDAELATERGDLDEAESSYRRFVETLEARGLGGFASTYRLQLVRTLLVRGTRDDLEEAEALIELAAAETVPGDRGNEAWIPSYRALLAARRGDALRAEEQARIGVEVADTTGWTWLQAEARVVLAFVLRTGGRLEEAALAEKEAITRYEQSGAIADVQLAKALLAMA